MEHKLCRDNLSAFLDGELPPGERAGVEAHLAGCAECRAELEQLKGVSGLLKKHVMEPVPLSLRGQVLGPRPARPWLKPVLALSTAAAGMLVVMNLFKAPETSYTQDAGFGARAAARMSDTGFTAADAAPEQESPAAGESPLGAAAPAGNYAPAAGAAGHAAGSSLDLAAAKEEKTAAPAVAAVRGSLAQAKFAAPRSAPLLAGGAAGAKAGALNPAAVKDRPARQPAMREFRSPVCVHVNAPPIDYEDDPALVKALDFMRKNCAATDQVFPGTLAFTKKDGRTVQLTERDAPDGIVLFDGVQDPLVVTDFASLPAVYARYFGK